MTSMQTEVNRSREVLVRYFNRLCSFDRFPSKTELREVNKYWNKIMKTDPTVIAIAALQLLKKEVSYRQGK